MFFERLKLGRSSVFFVVTNGPYTSTLSLDMVARRNTQHVDRFPRHSQLCPALGPTRCLIRGFAVMYPPPVSRPQCLASCNSNGCYSRTVSERKGSTDRNSEGSRLEYPLPWRVSTVSCLSLYRVILSGLFGRSLRFSRRYISTFNVQRFASRINTGHMTRNRR